jgi:eukaryotic-like serine/threonine-protein kinase
MSQRFLRCPHCRMPHDAALELCPTTGRRMPARPPREALRESIPLRESRPPPAPSAPPPAPIPEPGPTRVLSREIIGMTVANRYVIKKILGEGGMGTVYEAEHLGLGRVVAVKVLNASQAKKIVAVKRFEQEARAAGAIGHPNICEVYDMGTLPDGCPFLVMEKLDGETLADRISHHGGLPVAEVLDIMIQVSSGLEAAHERGVLHRDIKPENVFLAKRVGAIDIAKLLDFGVSKFVQGNPAGEEELNLTRTGMVMGTPYYMSPEQARGERNLDARVDIYACGVVLYEALTGKRPFVAPNYNALLLQIITVAPRRMADLRGDVPPAVEALVVRAMARSKVDRPDSAAMLRRELTTVRDQLFRRAARAQSAPPRQASQPPPVPVRPSQLPPPLPKRASQPTTLPLRPSQMPPPPDLPPLPALAPLSEADETRMNLEHYRSPSAPPPVPPVPRRTAPLGSRSDFDEIPTRIQSGGKTPLKPIARKTDWDAETVYRNDPLEIPDVDPDATVRMDRPEQLGSRPKKK